MDDRRLNIQNILMNFLFFSSFCGLMLFTALYLSRRGFSASMIGMILCLGNFLGSVEQGFLAKRADQKGPAALIRYGIYQLGLVAAAFLPLLLHPPLSRAYVFFAFFLAVTNTISVQTTFSSLVIAYESSGRKIHFSFIRGVGSFGFAFSSWVMGLYFVSHSIEGLIGIVILLNILCMILMGTLSLPDYMDKGQSGEEALSFSDPPDPDRAHFFCKYPIFLIFLGFVLIFMVYTFINNYLTVIVSFKGGDAGKAGLAAAIAAITEIPPMFIYLKLREKAKDFQWLIVAAIAFTIKAALLAAASSIGLLYLSQAVQFISFGLFLPAFAYFINDLVKKEDLIQGQGIPTAIMSLGGGLGSLLGGFSIDRLGMGPTLLLMTLLSLAGSLLTIFSLHHFVRTYQMRP